MIISHTYRNFCYTCRRPQRSCLCHLIRPFDTRIQFVILMHPKEARKQKTGTGRLAHLALKNSQIHVGVDFSNCNTVNQLLSDPEYHSMLMYPGPDAFNVSCGNLRDLNPENKKLRIFIIDSTWHCAGKIMRLSQNIASLPRISFDLNTRSKISFKKHLCRDYLG